MVPEHTCICQKCGSQWNKLEPKPDNGPQCLACGKDIRWSWCSDCFVIRPFGGDWKYGESLDVSARGDLTVNFCLCGAILNVVSPHFGVEDIYAPANVDWELTKNSYP